ncbi:hypothetical protein P3X46_026824 [Hevea brasiliensis]|uniref:Trichome birefringence-like N-terminal domain-containing protein n=1 Tax=Hevea brasiliensis TaxID=3981 RepID=A0ABQ9KZ25_HEVBR|nr:protein trichome birefringence [Hevea brasiliensis]KAJ9153379.1 hypothetical protein P3X46_026824 [Hevea brasiliensis]
MLDLSLSSLFSSKYHLPIKAIDTSKPIASIITRRRSFLAFAFGFIFIFVACTFLFAFNPSSSYFFYSSPWFNNFIRTTTNSTSSYKSQFSTLFSRVLYSSSFSHQPNIPFQVSNESLSMNDNADDGISLIQDSNYTSENNSTFPPPNEGNYINQLLSDGANMAMDSQSLLSKDSRKNSFQENQDLSKRKNGRKKNVVQKKRSTRHKALVPKRRNRKKKNIKWMETMRRCNIFDGRWVKDNSYPLFEPGSCPHIDEPFNCFINGRPDNGYQKYRWQPDDCNIPKLNGKHMLEMLRGKRLVFIGDSLNRNMWESMVCILRNAAKDKSKVFEASGKEEFKTEDSYSFVFEDYNCSVEFFRSTFLVQEWEMQETNGANKETLRIDLVERSADKYRSADVLVFNTGHWWTHEKTSSGKGYYQEGSHIYDELNVDMAFRKAMTTWAKWVEANVDPLKTLVVFRGYSVSHFRGGEWNSGGRCDGETEPLTEENQFENDPSMVKILESVLEEMKAPIFYLNVTRMTNFRRDAHPSIYREKDLPEEEKRSPLRFQDCSHWCLPGVPDTWNEIIYTQLLLKYKQNLRKQQQRHVHRKRKP